MKKIITAILILTVFCFAECKKSNPDSNGLPAATQDGKNTIGFLLNGQPWKPQGVRGTGNLSIDFDPGFNQGIFGIVAYNFVPTVSEQFKIGIGDSLNFVTAPKTYPITRNSLTGISFTNFDCGYYYSWSTEIDVTGSLTITKLDRINRIISGTFYATLAKAGLGCGTIKITDGRFDMKF